MFQILVVEDDASLRKLMSAALKQHGYSCHTANDGAEALDVMETTNISESVYNQLLIGTAFAAAIGTILSSVTNAFEIRSIKKIDQFGKYYGMQFIKGDGSTRVLSFHTHSHDSSGILGWHWQLSKYNPVTGKTSGTIARWLWWALWRI